MTALKAKTKPNSAAWSLPNGDAYYADAVKASTTTDYTPEQVHQLGLTQVAEISGRLDGILKKQGLSQGTVGARLVELNNRPDQVFPNTDAGRAEILKLLNDHIVDVYKLLPKAFRHLPKAKVEVRAACRCSSRMVRPTAPRPSTPTCACRAAGSSAGCWRKSGSPIAPSSLTMQPR